MMVDHHARDAFTCSPERLTSEMRHLIYVQKVVIGSYSQELIETTKIDNMIVKYKRYNKN